MIGSTDDDPVDTDRVLIPRRFGRNSLIVVVIVAAMLLVACRDRRGDPADTASTTPTATASNSTPDATTTEGPEGAATPASPKPAEPGTYERGVTFGGVQRSYLVRVPPSYDGVTAIAAVVVFHGGGGNADNAVRMTSFEGAADTHGFLAVFPNGSGVLGDRLLTWNSGNCCGIARDRGVDDVGFTRALVADLQEAFSVDDRRIYVTGMSNGGMMSYLLACRAADLIAAAAPVAGALNVENCAPSEPISLAAFHGTDDRHVLYEGGPPEVRVDRAERIDRSAAESVGTFVAADGCGSEPEQTSTAWGRLDTWSDCEGGTAVALYTIDGGGHAWPGGQRGTIFGDAPTTLLSATEAMWAFFEAHPKR